MFEDMTQQEMGESPGMTDEMIDVIARTNRGGH